MKNENIITTEEIENTLKEMSELSEQDRPEHFVRIAKKYGVYNFPADGTCDTYALYNNIQVYFQSRLMINACVSAKESSELAKQACSSAKWSCIWAAVAAIAACGSVVIMFLLN